MAEDTSWEIRFDASVAVANSLAASLREACLCAARDVRATITKDGSDTMDLGSTLVLIFGTGSAVAVAKGIQAWLTYNRGARISIKSTETQVLASGLSSKDVVKILEIFTQSNRP